jgi:hypothetical protein
MNDSAAGGAVSPVAWNAAISVAHDPERFKNNPIFRVHEILLSIMRVYRPTSLSLVL